MRAVGTQRHDYETTRSCNRPTRRKRLGVQAGVLRVDADTYACGAPGERWSLDFVSDTFRRIRLPGIGLFYKTMERAQVGMLAVNDDCCRETCA